MELFQVLTFFMSSLNPSERGTLRSGKLLGWTSPYHTICYTFLIKLHYAELHRKILLLQPKSQTNQEHRVRLPLGASCAAVPDASNGKR